MQRFAREMGKDVRGLTPTRCARSKRYNFPGNVRELENMIERAVALAGSRAIGLGDLPREVSGMAASTGPSLVTLPEEGCELDEVLGEVERRLMLEALERTGGVRKAAAKLLGITFRSLRYRLAKTRPRPRRHRLDARGVARSRVNPTQSCLPAQSNEYS